MANAAFQAITKRMAHYANNAIGRYYGVQWGANGQLDLADGTKPFAGVVEYGSDAENQVVTVVNGIFPCIAKDANVTKGAYVTFEDGLIKVVTTGEALGITVSAGTKVNDLVGVALFDAPFTIS